MSTARRRSLGLLVAAALHAGVASGAERLPFWRDGTLVAVEAEELLALGTDLDSLEGRVRTLLVPPPGLAVERLLPDGAALDSLHVAPPDLVVRLALSLDFLDSGGVTEELLESLSRQLDLGLGAWPELTRFHLAAVDPRAPGGRRALPSYLTPPDPELLATDPESDRLSRAPLVRRVRAGEGGGTGFAGEPGALDGKQVFVSQAHGFIDYDDFRAWSTQRGITHGIVEDFVNAEAINQMLLAYLEGSGAQVFTLRETDRNEQMVIVDEGDGGAFPANGTYVESGDPGAFSPSGQSGFLNFQAPYGATENPFANGGTTRLITTTATETARATWTPVFPAAGDYDVYVSYSRDGTARASDAHYVVHHTGGESHFRVNQERHGWVWVRLGRFRFDAGSDPARGSVALANDSSEPGETVAADAVRFGGGPGDILGHNHGTLSGRPRWEEGARTFTQYQGAPASVWSGGDVSARSRFAAWENFAGVEDSVYLSWHSNAFDGTARGTSSYVYSANPPDGTYDPTQSVPGSAALMNRIHDEIVADARALWDPAWQDRGYRSAYFGEVNPSNNPEMPSALLEVCFHDNAADAAALAHPRFRRLLARAIHQGIVRYFAERDGVPARLLPEPPRAVQVRATGATAAVVSWQAPLAGGAYGDPATGYRVYRGGDGRGFDDGTPADGTAFDLGGLVPGETVYLRVTATNAGGESLPSEVVALRTPAPDQPRLLLVHGFDRLDSGLLVREVDPDLGGLVQRMFLDRMNRFDGLVEHAAALGRVDAAFDSAVHGAVTSGNLALDPSFHSAILWQLGEESTVDETFDAAEQQAVEGYLAGGGDLFVSGAELAWDLDWLGSAADRAFLRGLLRARYAADDAGTYQTSGSAGGIFADLALVEFDDGDHGSYDVEYADVLEPEPGAGAALDYAGGAGIAALQADAGAYRVVTSGVPFETIRGAATRAAVMERVAAFFGLDVARFADGFESGDSGRWSSTAP